MKKLGVVGLLGIPFGPGIVGIMHRLSLQFPTYAKQFAYCISHVRVGLLGIPFGPGIVGIMHRLSLQFPTYAKQFAYCIPHVRVGLLGIEPRLYEPESYVMPLYHNPKTKKNFLFYPVFFFHFFFILFSLLLNSFLGTCAKSLEIFLIKLTCSRKKNFSCIL